MTLVPVGDVVLSTVDYLRTVPEVAAIVSTAAGWQTGATSGASSGPRISGARYVNWRVKSAAVVVRRAGGPPDNEHNGWSWTRLDVWCYGSTAREAVNLWRYVHPAVCPDQAGVVGWSAAGCRVANVIKEVDPIPIDDEDVDWPAILTPYLVRWRTL